MGGRLLAAAAALVGASVAFGQQRSFVSCPIVRDTKTVPCYLAEYEGETYFLGTKESGPDFQAPQLKHQVLVEGTVAPGARVCGGIPLSPVSISVLKELDNACNTLLPAEPGVEAPASSRQAAAPAESRRATAGKLQFSVLYAFNEDHLDGRGERALNEAAAYAKRIGASSVNVTGYRATSLLSSGQSLIEKQGIAEKRSQNVATILKGLGVSNVSADSRPDAEAGDGQTDASRRRVILSVMP